MRIIVVVAAILLAGCAGTPDSEPEPVTDEAGYEPAARVVAATFDTGTNPFHPCWQRPDWPLAPEAIPEIAGIAKPLELTFLGDYDASLEASQDAIDAIEDNTLYFVPGTNLLFYGQGNAKEEFVDVYPHGAQASSQIGCAEYGLAPEAWVVIVNWYEPDRLRGMEFVSQQPWIDVVHLNIQRITPMPPLSTPERELIGAMATLGQYVVLANGNGYGNGLGHIPSETIDFNSIPGTHLAGANDGTGYTWFSNPDPHTVMDGCGTVAAAPYSYGETSFGGTSSASPRTTGYVAQVLLQARQAVGHVGGITDGALALGTTDSGPMQDGILDRFDLHEVVRKTADPALASSEWDGESCIYSIPRYLPVDGADYHRVGYGKLTEATLPTAVSVAIGEAPMPERPMADRSYELSTTIRDAYWGQG